MVSLYILTSLLIFTAYNCVSGYVLDPIKEGSDVGLVFIPGAGPLWGYQYETLALKMQEVYQERLWIYLSNITLPEQELSPETADDQLNNTHIGRGRLALYEAGMPEEAPIYAMGHSAGGTIAYSEVEYTRVGDLANAIILLGATMWTQAYETYPVPVMAINGDLDGMMRVTAVSLDYRYAYDKILGGDDEYVYRYPHVMMEGVNHAQYVTGEYTDVIIYTWTEPEITDEQSMQLISEAVSTFIVYDSTTDDDARNEAAIQLDNYNAEIMAFLPPINQAFDAQMAPAGDTSPWGKQGQLMIADLDPADEQLIEINNTVVPREGILFNDPSISDATDGSYDVFSFTSLFYDGYVSANTLECKYKSSQAIKEAITGEAQDPQPTVTCKDINQAAWDQYYNILPQKSLDRYLYRNITVQFLEDESTETVLEWFSTDATLFFNGTHIDIGAVSYFNETNGSADGGMHHCKLASPARIMEFFYVDALYEILYFPTEKRSGLLP